MSISAENVVQIHGHRGPLIDLREVDYVLPRGEYPDECTLVMKNGRQWSVGSGYDKTALESAKHWAQRVSAAKEAAK